MIDYELKFVKMQFLEKKNDITMTTITKTFKID